MIILTAKIRKEKGKKVKILRKKGVLPAVLYGPKIKPESIEIDLKEFKKIFNEAGESSLINLHIGKEKTPVLIHEIKNDPVSDEIIHVDFYQPILTEEIEAMVPLIFEGVASAVKDLNGTLMKEIQELKVKALPQNLPHDIKVNIETLKTFEDEIKIKDLKLPENVKVFKTPDEIVVLVVPPAKVEEELQKPIEEKVEEIEKVEKEKKETEGAMTEEAKPESEKKPSTFDKSSAFGSTKSAYDQTKSADKSGGKKEKK